jgi:hypothetical protein
MTMNKRFVIADVDGDVLKLEISKTLLSNPLLVMGVCTDENGLIAQLNFDVEDVPTIIEALGAFYRGSKEDHDAGD